MLIINSNAAALRFQQQQQLYYYCNSTNSQVTAAFRFRETRLPARRHFASYTHHNNHHVQSTLRQNVSSSSSVVASFASYKSASSALLNNLHHIDFLTFTTRAASISAVLLFCASLLTLLAFKRAALSMEKLMDVAREEIPHTMIAARLSVMEISDFTMGLSDLGQGITRGVMSSTGAAAARLVEENAVSMKEEAGLIATGLPPGSAVARTARGIREGIVRGRAVLQMFFTLTQFSKMLLNHFKARGGKT